MPRPKRTEDTAIDYRPGQRDLDEVKKYERLMRTQTLEKGLRDLLPDPGAISDTSTLLPMLHLFRQENDRHPRANITLTLSLRTIELLSWLEHETAMKRGKVIDWVFAGFWAHYQEHLAEQREEERQAAVRAKRSATRRSAEEDGSD